MVIADCIPKVNDAVKAVRQTKFLVDGWWLVFAMSVWNLATGFIMIMNRDEMNKSVPGHQSVWNASTFGGHIFVFILYGTVYLVTALPMLKCALRHQSTAAGRGCGFVTFVLSLFIAITLILEALRTDEGWTSATNYLLVAVVMFKLVQTARRRIAVEGA